MLRHRDNARGSVGSRWPWSSVIAVWASECRLKAFLTRPAPALPPARESGVPRETLWWLIAFNHITRLQEEWAAIESAGKYSCSALKPTHSTFIQAAYCMCTRKQIHIYYGLKIQWGKKHILRTVRVVQNSYYSMWLLKFSKQFLACGCQGVLNGC